MLPDSTEKQQGQFFYELEEAFRTIANQQKSLVESRSLQPNVEHKLNYLKFKLMIKISRFFRLIKDHKGKILLALLPIGILILIFAVYSILLPKTINYDFATSSSCSSSPLLFPGLYDKTDQSTFTLTRKTHKLLGIDVYSSSICAKATKAPIALAAYSEKEWLNILGLHIGKTIHIKTTKYPLASFTDVNISSLPIAKPLKFKLSGTDATFAYAVSANGQTAPCAKQGLIVSCNLAPLKLAYGSAYNASLIRDFNSKTVDTVSSSHVQTITATAITATTIAASSTVQNKPQQIVLTTSKPLTKVETTSLTYSPSSGVTTDVPVTTTFKGNQITVTWTTVLPRQTAYTLSVENVDATDSSSLEGPYSLVFTTSAGPSVSSTNIPSYGLNSGQPMTLTFNQDLDPSQNLASEISLNVNGQNAPATVSLSGSNKVLVTPTGAYPVCATVKVAVAASVENSYDVSGNSAWSYTSRSHCYTTYSIGTSVEGRPITAYQFGSGPSMVLDIAAMEGNEQNSANLLTQWIPDVDANPQKIPSYRTLVIIPQINPDGYAADTRLNAAGTDLNRNFPANNWSEQVTEPLGNNVVTNDGGPNPLSAPESQALAAFYEAHKPRLTLTEHSHGGIVEANDAGDSIALGAQYAKLAGYKPVPTYEIGNFFEYTTTGAFEDWANDKLGLPVLEIELTSATNDEYSKNLPALWAMAQVSQ